MGVVVGTSEGEIVSYSRCLRGIWRSLRERCLLGENNHRKSKFIGDIQEGAGGFDRGVLFRWGYFRGGEGVLPRKRFILGVFYVLFRISLNKKCIFYVFFV